MSRQLLARVVASFALLIGCGLVLISFYYKSDSWQFPLLLGIGSALIPAALFALLSDISFSEVLLRRVEQRVDEIAERQIISVDERVNSLSSELSHSLQTLSTSTAYLSQSKALGIVMAHPDRRTALEHFIPYLRGYVANRSLAERQVVIVASSIKGVIEKFPDLGQHFLEVIEEAQKSDCNLRILLTHPAYSRHRETQESRQRYDIAKEILHAINWLERRGVKNHQIKLYKGTPTTFMIATHEKMLLNFYPYQTEAFNCFCLEVQNTGADGSIFRSFYDNHFLKPWEGEIDERDHYIKTNSLTYSHEFFDGPTGDPATALEDMKGPYGDFFVIDDEGTFYIAINIRRLRHEVVYERLMDGTQHSIRIGNRLEVRLLVLGDRATANWTTIGTFEIDPEHREGFWESTIGNRTFRAISMIGLFDPGNANVFKHVSSHPELEGQPLPMLFKWLTPIEARSLTSS